MKQFIICLLISFGLNSISFGQCLCAHIYFQFKTTDLNIENDSTNYAIEFKITEYTPRRSSHISNLQLLKSNVNGENLKFSIPTGGGIDTLKISIKNLSTKEEMVVTTTGLGYDIPYYIDLLDFSKGNYAFHWKKITECIIESKRTETIICGENKFSLIYTDRGSFFKWSIKPLSLEYFKTND